MIVLDFIQQLSTGHKPIHHDSDPRRRPLNLGKNLGGKAVVVGRVVRFPTVYHQPHSSTILPPTLGFEVYRKEAVYSCLIQLHSFRYRAGMASSSGSARFLFNRNALPSLLAPDLLTIIFFQLMICCEMDEYQWRRSPYSWIKATHVCRHWRTNALTTPLLWNHVNIRHSDWTQECLSRSGQAPLHISLLRGAAPVEDSVISLCLVLRHYPRIRTIRLEIPRDSYHWMNGVADVEGEAPLLQSLSLQMTDIGLSDGSDMLLLFLNGMRILPSLTTLELDGFRNAWSSRHLPGSLRHLRIIQCHYLTEFGTMIDALRMLPRLESLEVLHAIPVVTGEQPQIPIDFQHLHFIKLVGDAANCGRLLSLIKCQRAPTLELECYLDDQHSQLPSFTRALVQQLCIKHPGETSLQSIVAACEGDDPWRTLRIRGWTTVEHLGDIREGHGVGADLNVVLTMSEDLHDSESTALQYLFSHLPLSNVRAIWLDSVLFRRSNILLNIFDQMNELRNMAFTAIRGLDALFRRASHLRSDDTENTPLFPKVSTIVLEAIRFTQPMVTHLQDFLKDRRTAGMVIHEITLIECDNLNLTCIEEFQAHCIEVHWDQFESVTSPYDEEKGGWRPCENTTSDEVGERSE